MNAPVRNFEATPAVRADEPLLLGMVGPPGGGKTLSALRLAKGMQAARGGDIVLIDTEGGRARKYAEQVAFNIVELNQTRSEDFLDAIRAQLSAAPAAIIVDSMSDEHESYLEWHDEMIPKMGNNEWAAWAKPKAARKKLISGLLKIKTPLIFTFRAREKTRQGEKNGRKVVENIGWMPVAPLEIVHTLDLTCILPPRADGVPVWESAKIGEDFIIKLPNFLAPLISKGPLDEATGRALAEWARGSTPSPRVSTPNTPPGDAAGKAAPADHPPDTAGAADGPETDSERIMRLDGELTEAAKGGWDKLTAAWRSISEADQDVLRAALNSRHKPAARVVDQARAPA